MKKLLSILSIGSIAFTSTMTAVSCKKKSDNLYTIKVQAERDWLPLYQKVADKFNESLQEQNSLFKIQIKESGTFDELGLFDKLPFTDNSLSDVFVLPFDRFSTFVSKNSLADMTGIDIAEFDNRLGTNLDNAIATVSGKKYGVTLNIETLISVYNKAKLTTGPVKSLEEMTVANKTANKPVYNATFGDLWYGSVLYNALLTDVLPTLVEVKTEKDSKKILSHQTVFDNTNEDYRKVATASYEFGHTLPNSMFDTSTRWVGGEGLYDSVLKKDTSWFLTGPWDYSKKYTSTHGELNNTETVFGIKRDEVAFAPVTDYTVNQKQWKHFKGGFTMSMNARLDRGQKTITSANKTKKVVAGEFIKELLGPENAYDWFKYAGKVTPYKLGIEKLLVDAAENKDVLVGQLVDAIITGFAQNSSRPDHEIFNGFWGTYETNYNATVFPETSRSKTTSGIAYAETLAKHIQNYIDTYKESNK